MPGSPNINSASSGNAAMQEATRKMEARLTKLELAYTSVTAEVNILKLVSVLYIATTANIVCTVRPQTESWHALQHRVAL
jgi:hypothetical protein